MSPKGVARSVLTMLKNRGTIGIVLDQRIPRGHAVMVNFFGRPAPTMPFLAVLAERTGAPVVPVFSIRVGINRHRIITLPEVPFVETGDRQQNIKVNTQRYTTIIEQMVRRFPEQWLWAHRRWVSRRRNFD